MENDSRFRAAFLGALLAAQYPAAKPHHIAVAVFKLQLAAVRAVRWETRCCNYPVTEEQNNRGYARLRKAERELDTMLRALDPAPVDPLHSGLEARVKLGGDARGRCASLLLPGLTGDGWGDGFAIY